MSKAFTKEQVKGLQIGQKIKVVTSEYDNPSYVKGDILTVTGKDRLGHWIDATNDNKHGVTCTLYHYEAAADTPELKFKVGDKVVVGPDPTWGHEGDIGTVIQVDTYQIDNLPYYVRMEDEQAWWLRAEDLSLYEEPLADWERELLEATPREIAFAGIQKGDTLKAEYTYCGVNYTLNGVAHEQSTNDRWESEGGNYIASTLWNAKYTLLERPEVNPFVAKPIGTIARKGKNVWIKAEHDDWRGISSTAKIGASCGVGNIYPQRENWEIIHTP